MVSQKCQYSLRAIFELAKRYGKGPVKIAEIAQAQAIPVRFLEVILSQLKQGGFVDSRRGNEGGYYLLREPAGLTVAEVMSFIEGPIGPVECVTGSQDCAMRGSCVFLPMWTRVQKAVSDVYSKTSFQDLVDEEMRMSPKYVASYHI